MERRYGQTGQTPKLAVHSEQGTKLARLVEQSRSRRKRTWVNNFKSRLQENAGTGGQFGSRSDSDAFPQESGRCKLMSRAETERERVACESEVLKEATCGTWFEK